MSNLSFPLSVYRCINYLREHIIVTWCKLYGFLILNIQSGNMWWNSSVAARIQGNTEFIDKEIQYFNGHVTSSTPLLYSHILVGNLIYSLALFPHPSWYTRLGLFKEMSMGQDNTLDSNNCHWNVQNMCAEITLYYSKSHIIIGTMPCSSSSPMCVGVSIIN